MNRKFLLALIASFLVATGIVSLFFNSSLGSERRLRQQKERELASKIAELNETQSQIDSLKQARQQLEDTDNAKLAALQAGLDAAQNRSKTLESQVDALKQQNDLLLKDNESRAKESARLTERIKALEGDRRDLLDKIKDLQSKNEELSRAAANDTGSGPAPTEEKTANPPQPYGMRDLPHPEIDAVKLGKIIVQKDSGNAAQVESVNPVQNFIIINVGSRDGVREGTIINIVRDTEIIGKAVVKKTRDNLAAAILLPEWTREAIEPGDFVTRF